MTEEEMQKLAYIIAGAVSAVFMKQFPDLEMPVEEIRDSVDDVMRDVGLLTEPPNV